jgi:hypothetical protein
MDGMSCSSVIRDCGAPRRPSIRLLALPALSTLLACAGGATAMRDQALTPGEVLRLDFDRFSPGVLKRAELERFAPTLGTFYQADRATVVHECGGDHALRVDYPKGLVGPGASGIVFVAGLPPATEYYLSYSVQVGPGFDFRNGGKLPGLASAACRFSGGRVPVDGEGWSARLAWKGTGSLSVYLYHAGMKGPWGDGVPVVASLADGLPHTVVERVRLNTQDRPDGVLEVWVDGKLGLSRRDIVYRHGDKGLIDALCFSTFHGGNAKKDAPATSGTAIFDDVVVSTFRPAGLEPEPD